jgi:hypothetical protein
MYTLAFVLGFFTSFGWWSAGKIQKAFDNTSVQVKVEVEEKK